MKFLYRVKRKINNNSIDADIYVISYPKSGRTWLRALIGKYLSLKYLLPEHNILLTEFMTSKSGLPVTSFSHDGSAMKNKTRYRNLAYDRNQYANKRVIMLGRDIKDTLVSAYFQATKRINVYKGTISEFVKSERFGAKKILTFYDIWLKSQHIPVSFLLIRYEDLHRDIKNTFRKVLNFIGEVHIEENLLDGCIDYCSFNNLRKMEINNSFESNILKSNNNMDPNSFKVRKGKIGGYSRYLSKKDVKYIDKLIASQNFDFSKYHRI